MMTLHPPLGGSSSLTSGGVPSIGDSVVIAVKYIMGDLEAGWDE